MTYYLSKIFWLLAAPTNALILISAIAAVWAVLGRSNCAARLAAVAACVLVIGALTPIGLALRTPLEYRFPFSPPDPQASPDGIILLGGGNITGIDAALALSKEYPKARLIFSGFNSAPDKYLLDIFVRLGGDAERLSIESRPRTTSEDALYAAGVLKPKTSEKWLLVTSALHMPRAVGCFRAVGFQVKPYREEAYSEPTYLSLFSAFTPGTQALNHLDTAVKEWIGLVVYRLMGKTDALFPGP
jgi:uncharacterized SAM-binding protein YcdF (DUF218 family)